MKRRRGPRSELSTGSGCSTAQIDRESGRHLDSTQLGSDGNVFLRLLSLDCDRRQNKELNNGRLAMLAIAGMVVQEAVTGGKLF